MTRQFSRKTELDIQRMLRWFKQFGEGGDLGEVPPPSPPPARHIRWAITVETEAVPTYPTTGNTLPIKLGEYVFDDTQTGAQTPTFTAYPDEERIAHFIGGYAAKGMIVRVSLHDNMWWSFPCGQIHVRTGPTAGHPEADTGWTHGDIGGVADLAGTLKLGWNYCELWGTDADGYLTETLDPVSGYSTPIVIWNKSTVDIPVETHLMAYTDCTGLLVAHWMDCP